jgi:hypothetical protein
MLKFSQQKKSESPSNKTLALTKNYQKNAAESKNQLHTRLPTHTKKSSQIKKNGISK